MKSKVYSLIEPYTLVDIEKERELQEDWVAVKPMLGSICHADLRYFTGNRRPEALKAKLPMALIHEGIGVVVDGNNTKLSKGDYVVVVPNIPARLIDLDGGKDENDQYSSKGRFMGSGYDGLAQSLIVHPEECLVKIPEGLSFELATLSEVSSVGVAAIRGVEEYLNKENIKVALFGDGPVGFVASAFIKYHFGLREDQFTVFGADDQKLKHFDFTKTENVLSYDFDNPKDKYDVIIECTGGKFSEGAINQSIKIANSLGHIVLMGVTEGLVPINTRDILEKGLTIYGSSRSVTKDFKDFVTTLSKSNEYQKVLSRLLNEDNFTVSSPEDFYEIMNYTAKNPGWKRTIMAFDWGDK